MDEQPTLNVERLEDLPAGTLIQPLVRVSRNHGKNQQYDCVQRRADHLVMDCLDVGCTPFEPIVESGVSGQSLERPGLMKAIEIAKQTGAVIVVSDVSRLLRNKENPKTNLTLDDVKTFNEFVEKHGVRFASIADPTIPEERGGKFLLHRLRTAWGLKVSSPKQSHAPNKGQRKLPLEHRKAMKTLRDVHGYSFRQLGELYKVSASTVHRYVSELPATVLKISHQFVEQFRKTKNTPKLFSVSPADFLASLATSFDANGSLLFTKQHSNITPSPSSSRPHHQTHFVTLE